MVGEDLPIKLIDRNSANPIYFRLFIAIAVRFLIDITFAVSEGIVIYPRNFKLETNLDGSYLEWDNLGSGSKPRAKQSIE